MEAHNHYRRCHGVPDLWWAPELRGTAKNWVHTLLQHCGSGPDLEAWATAGVSKGRPHDPNLYTSELPQQGEQLSRLV